VKLSEVYAALLGRHFWIPSTVALLLGFFLPGDYTGWRWSATVVLGAILFFSCLNVRFGDLRRDLGDPRLFGRIAALSAVKLGLLPIAGWGLAAAVAPSWAPGVLLVSAMPAGLSSIAFTDLNRGNRVLALLLVLATSMLAPLTVPVLLQALGSPGTTLAFRPMLERAAYIAEVLAVPFAAAQLVRRLAPKFVDARPASWTRGAIFSSCLLVFISIAINRPSWAAWHIVAFAVPLALATAASALFAGACWVVQKRLTKDDAVAFSSGAIYVNNGLAIVLAVRFFPDDARMLLPAVLMQLPMLAGVALIGKAASARRAQPPIGP
jgi:bile acid:Na+ symporter, BASS family